MDALVPHIEAPHQEESSSSDVNVDHVQPFRCPSNGHSEVHTGEPLGGLNVSEHGPDGTLVVRDETLDHLFNDVEQSNHSPYSNLVEFDDGPRGVFVDDNVSPVDEFCRT